MAEIPRAPQRVFLAKPEPAVDTQNDLSNPLA